MSSYTRALPASPPLVALSRCDRLVRALDLEVAREITEVRVEVAAGLAAGMFEILFSPR